MPRPKGFTGRGGEKEDVFRQFSTSSSPSLPVQFLFRMATNLAEKAAKTLRPALLIHCSAGVTQLPKREELVPHAPCVDRSRRLERRLISALRRSDLALRGER